MGNQAFRGTLDRVLTAQQQPEVAVAPRDEEEGGGVVLNIEETTTSKYRATEYVFEGPSIDARTRVLCLIPMTVRDEEIVFLADDPNALKNSARIFSFVKENDVLCRFFGRYHISFTRITGQALLKLIRIAPECGGPEKILEMLTGGDSSLDWDEDDEDESGVNLPAESTGILPEDPLLKPQGGEDAASSGRGATPAPRRNRLADGKPEDGTNTTYSVSLDPGASSSSSSLPKTSEIRPTDIYVYVQFGHVCLFQEFSTVSSEPNRRADKVTNYLKTTEHALALVNASFTSIKAEITAHLASPLP